MVAEAQNGLQTLGFHSEEHSLTKGSQQHGISLSRMESTPHDSPNKLTEMLRDLRQEMLGSHQEILNSLAMTVRVDPYPSSMRDGGPGFQCYQGYNEQQWQQDMVEMKQTLISIQQSIQSLKVQTSNAYSSQDASFEVGRSLPTSPGILRSEDKQDADLQNGRHASAVSPRGDTEKASRGSLARQMQQKKDQLMTQHGASQMFSDFEKEVMGHDPNNTYQTVLERRLAGRGFWFRILRLCGLERMLPKKMPNTAMARATQSTLFASCQTFLILSNTAFMGYETDVIIKAMLEEPPAEPTQWMGTVNLAFNVCFAAELIFRMFALRAWFWVAAREWAWNLFDVILVAFSIVSDWLLAGVNVSFIRTLRILRAVRVARVIRVFRFFRHLRQMLFAILACLSSLAWAFIFLVMVMFMFSILFLQGVANTLIELDWTSEEAQTMRGDVSKWFGSLGDAMLSLFAAVTGGTDWLDVKKPLDHAGFIYPTALIAYLLFIIIGVMNVLTGVFLSSSDDFFDLDLIGQREQIRVETFVGQMLEFFNEIDLNHTGEIDWQTFSQALKHENLKAFLASMNLEPTHIRLIFDLLDEKRTGKIAMADFVMSMVKMRGECKAIDARIIHRELSMLPMLLGQGVVDDDA